MTGSKLSTTASGGRLDVRQLLKQSFLPGDHLWIEAALQERSDVPPEQVDEDELHWLLMDVVELFKAHPSREAAPSVGFVYEHTPCANCRQQALKLLVSTGSLPSWIADEARLDASGEIRELLEDHDAASGRRPPAEGYSPS